MLPEPDLEQVARDAVAAGLFTTDPDVVRANAAISNRYQQLPTRLLDMPYVNGPVAIEIYGFDVQEPTVFSVRRNFTEANRLLLPKEQVLRYFHQRFVADDVFTADLLVRMVQGYRAPMFREMDDRVAAAFAPGLVQYGWIPLAANERRGPPDGPNPHAPVEASGEGERHRPRFQDAALSFQIEGVDRKSHTRALYTREEQLEGLRRVHEAPGLLLTILAYQSVIRRYLGVLRDAFAGVTTESALADFDKYCAEWNSANFTNELVPALAIFMHVREHASDAAPHPSADAELFRDAVNFIVENGAFRNWITIPAAVTAEREERVDHFLCPAMGILRDQLLDGSLLSAIYGLIVDKARTNDPDVSALLDTIQTEAGQKLEESQKLLTEDDLMRRVSMSVTYGGRAYTFRLDDASLLQFARGEARRNDTTLTPALGSWLFDVLREAISLALARRTPVCFQFNGRGYRFTPGSLADFLRQRQQ